MKYFYIFTVIAFAYIILYNRIVRDYRDRIDDPAEYYRIQDEVEDWKKRHNKRV